MKHSPRAHRVSLSLLALGAFAAASLAGTPAGAGERDHLKCYDVVSDERRAGTTKLAALDSLTGREEGCYIYNQARIVCNAVAKNGGNDPRAPALPSTFYTCYALVCPHEENLSIGVSDQFFTRVIQFQNTRWLCAPAILE